LRDVAVQSGFKPIAAAAFIGEHSFSTDAAPIAIGRPDIDDLKKAHEFGTMINEKLHRVRTLDELSVIQAPGNFPYKERSLLANIAPITRDAACAQCGDCAAACPTAAITVHDTVMTDGTACIRCCACVKACSTGARVMEDARVQQVAKQLSMNCGMRKKPELYV
jgi:ferredoxin